MKIALFGTSADPPTIGHQEIIKWLASNFDWVAVWAADNPFKDHGASLVQRSQMLELLIDALNLPIERHAQVHPELSSQRTIETVITAQKIWTDGEFTLVIGADLIPQLPQWYRVSELLTLVSLLVVPRQGNLIEPIDLQALVDLGTKITIAPLNTPAISSTSVRTNPHTAIQGLTPSVATYIQQQVLYGFDTII
jgi:nicotinate-nucleotide adenylyltransferase